MNEFWADSEVLEMYLQNQLSDLSFLGREIVALVLN